MWPIYSPAKRPNNTDFCATRRNSPDWGSTMDAARRYSGRYSGGEGSATRRRAPAPGPGSSTPRQLPSNRTKRSASIHACAPAASPCSYAHQAIARERISSCGSARESKRCASSLARSKWLTCQRSRCAKYARKSRFFALQASCASTRLWPRFDGIARPRYEVIDTARAAQLFAAVETLAALMLMQHGAEAVEACTLVAEQKRPEVGVGDHVLVRTNRRDPAHPRATYCIDHETVKRAECRRHPRQQANTFVCNL